MSASTFSCVICAYNEAQRIGEVLCVVATHPLFNEVIVVDDGSTDNTADIVRSFPSVRLISSAENRGKSRAFAEAVRAAKNDYIMCLDADLKHLTAANITELAEPVLSRRFDMSISVRKNEQISTGRGRQLPIGCARGCSTRSPSGYCLSPAQRVS
jgi:glycosyltransferase involved in cell wall biosynthesis